MLFTLFSSYVQSGVTPLLVASFYGHQKCMELLIDAGANVDLPTEVRISSCTHISEATSHRASPCSVGPLDTRASHVCVESTGSGVPRYDTHLMISLTVMHNNFD